MGCANSKNKKGVEKAAPKAAPAPVPAAPAPEPVAVPDPVPEKIDEPTFEAEAPKEEPLTIVEEPVVEEPLPVALAEFPLKQSSWFHQGSEYDLMLEDMGNTEINELVEGIWKEEEEEVYEAAEGAYNTEYYEDNWAAEQQYESTEQQERVAVLA
eukprot:Filipodium_phascolosomae@DN1628_c0_g1_i1.p2